MICLFSPFGTSKFPWRASWMSPLFSWAFVHYIHKRPLSFLSEMLFIYCLVYSSSLMFFGHSWYWPFVLLHGHVAFSENIRIVEVTFCMLFLCSLSSALLFGLVSGFKNKPSVSGVTLSEVWTHCKLQKCSLMSSFYSSMSRYTWPLILGDIVYERLCVVILWPVSQERLFSLQPGRGGV